MVVNKRKLMAIFAPILLLLWAAAAVVSCGASSKDAPHPISDVTHTNLRDMAKELFGKQKSMSSKEVVEKLEILKEFAQGEGLHLPMDVGSLLVFNEPLESKCADFRYMDELLETLSSVKFSHRALARYVRDCIERQMAVCHFGERVIKSLDGYDQSTGWIILKNFWRYAKKFGSKSRESRAGGFRYNLNGGAMREALEEMAKNSLKSSSLKQSFEARELAGQLRSVCDQLFEQEQLLRFSLHDPHADKQAKVLHKHLSLCQVAAGANFGGL